MVHWGSLNMPLIGTTTLAFLASILRLSVICPSSPQWASLRLFLAQPYFSSPISTCSGLYLHGRFLRNFSGYPPENYVFEFFERSGSYAAPLALLYLMMWLHQTQPPVETLPGS